MQIKYWIIGLVALLSVSSCGKENAAKKDDVKEVPVLTIKEKDTLVSNQFVADIQAKKNIEIHSRMSGIMQHVYAHEGQFVKRGQLLFKISDAELQMDLLKANATLKQAQADVRIAEVEVSQLQSLFNKNFVAKNELDMMKAKLSAAQARRSYADAERKAVLQKVSFSNITAPFDGVIDVIPFKDGSLVENGSLLTTLSYLDQIYAYFSIPENLYFELQKNDKLNNSNKIELVLPNGAKYDFNGVLKTAEGEIDQATGSIRYKVEFPNTNRLIKHGTSGKLMISDFQPNSIIIPQKATFSIQDKVYVFVVDAANKVKMKNITIANTLRDSYMVESGLKTGDRIVLEGTQALRDGQTIRVKK